MTTALATPVRTRSTPAARDLSTLPAPPFDRGLPVLGHLPEFIRARGPLLTRLYREHGPCFRVRLGLDAPVVMAGPEMSEFATKDGGRVLHAGPSNLPFVRELDGSNALLGADLGPHFHRRRSVMPLFTPGSVVKMVPRLSAIAREAAAAWSHGAPFDLLPALKRLVLRQTGLVLTGRDAEPLYPELCRYFDLALAVSFVRVPRVVLGVTGYAGARRRVLDFAQRVLDDREALAAPQRPGDLVDRILEAREPDGSPLDPGERRALVLAAFVGGLDTVAHTLAFLLYEVLKSPALYERCQREADALFDGDALDPSRLRALPTLAAAVQETLRVYPIAALGQRVAAESFAFAGFRVDRGTKLMMGWNVGNLVAPHHVAPDRFDVDRFLAPRSESASAVGAFGFGPHRCIGARLGEVQMIVTLATFLRHATMRLHRADAPLRTSSLVALKPVGLAVRFDRRGGG